MILKNNYLNFLINNKIVEGLMANIFERMGFYQSERLKLKPTESIKSHFEIIQIF